MKGSFIKALPIVAKALSENYGVSLAIYGDQAKTDGKRIVLPVLPEDDRKATILARGYLDHEAAHIRYTDFEIMGGSGLEQVLTNIIEDVRIEQAMGRRYRGCRENLHEMIRLLVEEGDFKLLQQGDPPACVVQGYLLYLLRSRILGQQALEPLASQAEAVFDVTFPGLRPKVEPIALEVKDAPDTRTVREIARRIIALLQDAASSPPENLSGGQDKSDESDSPAEPPSGGQENDGQEESSGSGGAGEESPDPSQPGSNQDGSQDSEADGQGESDESQSSGNNQADEQYSQKEGQPGNGQKSQPGDQDDSQGTGDGTDSGSGNSKMTPQGAQDGDGQEPLSSCQAGNSGGSTAAAEALADDTSYHDLGQIVAEKLGDMSKPESGQEMAVEIPAWWTEPLMAENELMQATARLRAMLAGVVQSKRSKRSRLSLSGTKLDLRNLHRLAVNDGRVFLSREERTGVNTAVYLLMDQSCSMSYTAIKTAFMATAALARALRSIPGTAVAAGAFSSKYFKGETNDKAYVASLLKFDESERRMSLSIPPPERHTPMAEAMYCVAAKLLFRPEPRRLLIVMTDGEPDDFKATQEIIGKCRIAGMEVYAVGIMESSVKPLFGKEFAIVVNTIGDLPERMFRLLANRL